MTNAGSRVVKGKPIKAETRHRNMRVTEVDIPHAFKQFPVLAFQVTNQSPACSRLSVTPARNDAVQPSPDYCGVKQVSDAATRVVLMKGRAITFKTTDPMMTVEYISMQEQIGAVSPDIRAP